MTSLDQRREMVRAQIVGRGIRDLLVVDAMLRVPREDFVAPRYRDHAYADRPLPIEAGQTISQPYVVALMAAALELGPGDRLLEIGAGSGYAAAVMSRIAREVFAIERYPALAAAATDRLGRLGYANVHVREGDGSLGWPEHAPYDAIAVAAAGPSVPRVLVEQLADGGRLVMPVGDRDAPQHLTRLRRAGARVCEEDLGLVQFVPLIGRGGYEHDGAPPPV